MQGFSCPSCGHPNKWEDVLLVGDLIDCEACGLPLMVQHITHWTGAVRVKPV